MVRKKTNVQNIIIVVLAILLRVSIGFGVTYSYYNGKSNLVKGSITTATLSIHLQGEKAGQTTQFSISAPIGEKYLVPGNNLENVKLNLLNQCNQWTYMVVVYKLSAVNESTNEDVSSKLQNMPAIAFKDNALDSRWKEIKYQCSNLNASYTCLVGINAFQPKETVEGYPIPVLAENSIQIPREWNDDLQNCNVTISVTAYAIQSENLADEYRLPILHADDAHDMEAKAQAIAKAVLEICKVDTSSSD